MAPRCFACRRQFPTGRSIKLHLRKTACGQLGNAELDHFLSAETSDQSLIVLGNLADDFATINVLDDQPEANSLPGASNPPIETLEGPSKKKTRVMVEDVEDEDDHVRFIKSYPGNAAEVLGFGTTEFQHLHDKNKASGQSPWEPFEDQDEFELAEWLMKRANKTGIEEFLNLPIV